MINHYIGTHILSFYEIAGQFYLSAVLHDSANSSHYLGLYIIFFGKKKERKYQDDQILNSSVFVLKVDVHRKW